MRRIMVAVGQKTHVEIKRRLAILNGQRAERHESIIPMRQFVDDILAFACNRSSEVYTVSGMYTQNTSENVAADLSNAGTGDILNTPAVATSRPSSHATQ